MKLHKSEANTYSRYLVAAILVVSLFVTCLLLPETGFCQKTADSLNGEPFHMAINRPEGEPYYTWITLIYAEVFNRLGLSHQFSYYPLRRASEEANTGRVDGEPARIHEYGASYTNLVRVEEFVFMMSVAAYTADPSVSGLDGWESLKTFEGVVEYPRGMKMAENNLTKVVDPEKLSEITEASQALRKLAINRIDLYVDDMNAVVPVLNDPKYDLKEKIHVAGIMVEVPLYMYIHKKHTALAPKLAEVIKAIKSEGLIEQYRKKAFGIDD